MLRFACVTWYFLWFLQLLCLHLVSIINTKVLSLITYFKVSATPPRGGTTVFSFLCPLPFSIGSSLFLFLNVFVFSLLSWYLVRIYKRFTSCLSYLIQLVVVVVGGGGGGGGGGGSGGRRRSGRIGGGFT